MAIRALDEGTRREALERAAEARRERAQYKVLLKAGEASLADALASQSVPIRRMRVRELLVSLPGVGRAGAEEAMACARVADGRRVSGLGPRQREALLAWWASRSGEGCA